MYKKIISLLIMTIQLVSLITNGMDDHNFSDKIFINEFNEYSFEHSYLFFCTFLGSSLLKPTNPFRSTSLQINGIAPDLSRKKLQEMFKEITGPLMEFKMHRSDNGSLVTLKFFDAQSARNAFAKIKQEELDGNLGLLTSDANLDIKLNIQGNEVIEYQEKNLEEIVGECLKWRTIGCHDDACQFLHIPVCKQIDHQLVKELDLKRTIDQDNMQYESDIQRDIFKRIKSEKVESEMIKPSDRQMVSYDDLF